ncbi:MAG: flagellar motor switch protein FliN [Chloroflexi bacterium]|nr:flagellar motor switch protein FliN [Chloroflexota bacterium]
MSDQSVQANSFSLMQEDAHAPASPDGARALAGFGAHNPIDMLMDVTLQLSVILGRARLSVRQVLDLQKGSVLELDRMAGDVVDVFVNDRLVAQGEVVVVDDKFGVRVTQLVAPNRDLGGIG